jgi:hypothetical protein
MRFIIPTVLAGFLVAVFAVGCGGSATTESKTTRLDPPVGARGGTAGKQLPAVPPIPTP